MPVAPPTTVNVRYIVRHVDAAIAWYTKHLGFTVLSSAAPAFADITLGSLRLLLSGPTSSAGRPMPDSPRPEPGGWNRVHLIVNDLSGEVARLRAAGVKFRNEIVTGPGGKQILMEDPSGNPIELFQPANRNHEHSIAGSACCRAGLRCFGSVLDVKAKRFVIGPFGATLHDAADWQQRCWLLRLRLVSPTRTDLGGMVIVPGLCR